VKFLRVLVRVIDYAAIGVAFIAFATAIGAAVMIGLYNAAKFLFHGIADGWSNGSDRWLLIAVAVSAVWCWIRWDALNKPGG
jgi:hypothetical protein